jgi:hypothetical protein
LKTLGDGLSIQWRRESSALNGAACERGEHFRRPAGLNHSVVASRFHADSAEGFGGKIMRRAADAGDADFLTA